MKLIQGADLVPEALRGSVLALGNFDGVHRGHQSVLAGAKSLAADTGRPAGVMVFEPHPREFFQPDRPLFRLTPLDVKSILLEALGLDLMVVMTFDAELAGLSAGAFVKDVLCARLGISHAVAGFNFHFGKARAGTPEFLKQAGAEHGFGVTIAAPAGAGETPYSSSAVRARLIAGEVEKAAELLGYRWFVRGEVIAGDKRGRTLNYPTANMALPQSCGLRHGIYAVRLRRRVNGTREVHGGVASFGVRPTFGGGRVLLETHLFDFSGDLYGQTVDVEFLSHLRDEAKFDGAEALIAQMDQDAAAAREVLANLQSTSPGSLEQAIWNSVP